MFFPLSQEFEQKYRIGGTCAAVLLDSEEPHEMLLDCYCLLSAL